MNAKKTIAKVTMAAALATTALSAQPASAEVLGGEMSANVGLFTDYIFRGLTQTDGDMALQGGIDWAHSSGLYVGTWGSNVDFSSSDSSSLELDGYFGFANSIDAFSYDIGFAYYAYPGAKDSLNYDFWEIYASVGYDFDFIAPNASIYYADEFFGEVGSAVYYQLGADVPLPYDIGFSAWYGWQTFDDNTAAGSDYDDWGLGLGYTIPDAELDLSLTYTETVDLASDNSALVFGISKSF